QYIARSLGCGRLRPGILVGFSDRTAQLDARLPAIDDPGCYATAVLTPESVEAARRMTSRAFSLDAALAQLPALEERKNALSANVSATRQRTCGTESHHLLPSQRRRCSGCDGTRSAARSARRRLTAGREGSWS